MIPKRTKNESIHQRLTMRIQHFGHSNEREQHGCAIILLLINSEDL